MNKADLIEAVAKVTNTKKEAGAAVDCVFDAITKALKRKEDVTLIGFGTFGAKKEKPETDGIPGQEKKLRLKRRRFLHSSQGKH